ncbi:MAG TPA: tetraacyldisaccharide 4'-kinase [Acidobacteriaceae bacterium]|nr:tetraacyldisaccharide 4'-kinase [Acidobacteriaceae bacterium]
MSASIVRQTLLPFTLIYAAGVRFKNTAYDRSLLRPAHLAWPVISIGNLSVGGAGKTSMVLLLARLLAQHGWAADVLSRGYGRTSRSVTRVKPDGTVAEYGDEPLMMARRGLPVYVGAERFQAGVLAEQDASRAQESRARLHLLDDGFQHRRLLRHIEIVLLKRSDLSDDMLPAGRLREPLSSLERADICVLRQEDADLSEQVLRLMRTENKARLWYVERRTVVPKVVPRRSFAFCAVGEPEGFFRGLRAAGVELTGTLAFRDHHAFTHRDVDRMEAAARDCAAECLLTSEKDSMRLEPDVRARLEDKFPLAVAGLEVSLRNEADAMARLLELLEKRLQLFHCAMR